MDTPRFDPTHSVEFNLGRGLVKVDGESPRLLIPADAVLSLAQAAGRDALRDFAYRLGSEAGRRAASRLGEPSGMEGVAEHLGGELALMGFGSLALERWGHALVAVFSHTPFGPEGDELVATILEGALQRAFGRETAVVPIHRDHPRVRYLVIAKGSVDKVRGWLNEGVAYTEVLSRLHGGQGSP